MPSSHLILCRPLLLLPPIPPASESFPMSPKYGSFSYSISPSKHPWLISFRMDWLDLLAVQETLKSLLQHHSLKASVLWHSAFFIVQLSHPYMTTGKTIALTRSWRGFLQSPWTARRSNQSILKEINLDYSLEGLMLKLKFQYLATWWEELTHWKRPWCWERLRTEG